MIENIKFDYYNSKFSYMRFIMEQLGKSKNEQMVVGEIFNTFLSKLDDIEIDEIVIYSALFERKMLDKPKRVRMESLNDLYDCYIRSMIVLFSNNDMDALEFFYNSLTEEIKVRSCYYGIYGDDGYFGYVNQTSNLTK